jgi:hypothetical protein
MAGVAVVSGVSGVLVLRTPMDAMARAYRGRVPIRAVVRRVAVVVWSGRFGQASSRDGRSGSLRSR